MNVSLIQIWPLLAGLGLFLLGISTLEDSLKALAGRSFKLFLKEQTGNSLKAVLSGALASAVLQSSSMVTLLVMSFTGAGIIRLKNGIGIILGSNLGTTFTGWLVALLGFRYNTETFSLALLGIGSLGSVFIKNNKLTMLSRLILGFSFMFLGLSFMKNGFQEFTNGIDVHYFLDNNPAATFVIFGFVIAALIQSSSASMMLFLASLSTGLITLHQGAYLAIGANLGTTVTGLIGTINGNSIRKKTGWSQFYFNVIIDMLALLMIDILLYFIQNKLNIQDRNIALVAFHSIFNFIGIIFILPFLGYISHFLDKHFNSKNQNLAKFLYATSPGDIDSSLDALNSEAISFLNSCISLQKSFIENSGDSARIMQKYYEIKKYENEIFTFITAVMQNKQDEKQSVELQLLSNSIRYATLSLKGIKDIAHNLEDARQSANDNAYHQLNKLVENQMAFYRDFDIIIQNLHVSTSDDFNELSAENKLIYTQRKSEAFAIYATDSNYDLASFLNMFKEIYDSRELLIKSGEQLIH